MSAMVVGCCRIELNLPGVHSLKAKRGTLKSLIAQVHRKFNVSAAEVDLHDVWQSSTLGVTVVSNASGHCQRVLESVVQWIESSRPDVDILDYDVETIHV